MQKNPDNLNSDNFNSLLTWTKFLFPSSRFHWNLPSNCFLFPFRVQVTGVVLYIYIFFNGPTMAHTWILVHSWGPEEWCGTDLVNQRFSFWDVGWSACFFKRFCHSIIHLTQIPGQLNLFNFWGCLQGQNCCKSMCPCIRLLYQYSLSFMCEK